MNTRWRLLLADDHDVVLAGLRLVLNTSEFEIVGAVGDGRALVAAAAELRPDVIVTDIGMPLLNGLDAARQIRKVDPRVGIIFLTMHSDLGYATEALSIGRCGYVLKSSVGKELPTAIHEVLAGRQFVAGSIRESVRLARAAAGQNEGSPADRLTLRQREVLQLLAEGCSAKEIGYRLAVSSKTVEFHKHRIKEQLGVTSLAELARFAAKKGIVT